jgi:uncharacterized protein with NRDE domain
MCIAYLALDTHPDWPVFIAANRDEFHERPARPAAPWPNAPRIIGGIDLRAGGTWLGVDHFGRYALITNFREPGQHIEKAPSRGDLTRSFLEGKQTAKEFASLTAQTAQTYNGFNLIVGQGGQAFYVGNRSADSSAKALGSGRFVMSNHLLDTPWPKAQRLRQALLPYPGPALNGELDEIFQALKDTTQAQDHALPATGLPVDRERLLSSPFIISPAYGTRCSTILALHRNGQGILAETSYSPEGQLVQRSDWPFRWQPPGLPQKTP